MIAGLTPAGRGRGVHRRRRSHDRRHHLDTHTWSSASTPRPNTGDPEQPDHGGRGVGQADGRRARGRQHHRHGAWYANAPGGGDGLVPGHGRAAPRSAGCCSATSNFSGKLPDHLGRAPRALADVRQTPAARTTMDYCLGYRYFDQNGTTLTPAQGIVPVRVRPVVHDVQLQQPAGAVLDGRRRTAIVNVTVDVNNTERGRRRRRRSSCSCRIPAPRSRTAPASYKELKGFYRVSLAGKAEHGRAKRSRSRCA